MTNELTPIALPIGRRSRLRRPVRQLLTCAAGVAAEFALAALLHYLWEWSRHLLPVAVFAAVNESVWEHVKILCWPFLLWSIAEYYILRPNPRRLLISRTVGVLTAAALTVCFFYIYSGILGRTVIWVDVVSAALWLAVGEFAAARLLNSPAPVEDYWLPAAAALLLLAVMLLCFSASPPRIGLFRDPLTGLYGLETRP